MALTLIAIFQFSAVFLFIMIKNKLSALLSENITNSDPKYINEIAHTPIL
jgi:hypothetical protein